MDLNIKITGATMYDLADLLTRMGTPTMEELFLEEKVSALQTYINQGYSLQDALNLFQDEIQAKVNEIEGSSPQGQPVQQELPGQVGFDGFAAPEPQPVDPIVYTPPQPNPGFGEVMPTISNPAADPVNNQLHLNQAPPITPQPKAAEVNIDDSLRQLATSLVEKSGSKRLSELLLPYGATSIMDINNMHKQEFLDVLKRELA